MKEYGNHIRNTMNVIDTELRELTEKGAVREIQLSKLLK